MHGYGSRTLVKEEVAILLTVSLSQDLIHNPPNPEEATDQKESISALFVP